MITVDKLLLKIVNNSSPTIEELLQKNDSRILRSLATSVASDFFITENQSRLLLKILKENAEKLSGFSEELGLVINAPTWTRRFRQIEQVRKLTIDRRSYSEPCITIEFTFNTQIRKNLQNMAKKIENLVQVHPSKCYTAELTEKNIVTLVDGLKSFNFTLCEEFESCYNTIKSWSKQEISDNFLITNIVNQNFQKHITADLGVDTAIDQNIIKDRSVRYQYNVNSAEKADGTLVSYIANRTQPRFWVNKKEHSLDDVIKSLITLRRLPLMVVFDSVSDDRTLQNMEILDEILKKHNLTNNVGIYFRLSNTEVGKKFNQVISDNNYNCRLDDNTQVVAVQSGKIPKFFLNSPWKPMSVLALDNTLGLRHGKTSVYSNCCDLIIEYAEEPSLKDKGFKW